MTAYVDGPVRVSVPATTANLGPGFDSLGLALDLRDELEAEVLPLDPGTGEGPLDVEVHGVGADAVPRDESHLVVRAMRTAFAALGGQPPGLRLRCHNLIPHARGLGSSSAAIVAGVVLARELVAEGRRLVDDDELFRIAADLEGHPDNVAPAMFGGFVISGREAEGFYAVSAPVDPRIGAVVFVPPAPLSTEVARGLLPDRVPHADAAADAGRTALLVAALAGRPEHLLLATRDYLHQEYRRPAMPESLALIDRLREAGVPAVVSGAGPTVLAFTTTGPGPAAEAAPAAGGVDGLRRHCPEGWACHELALDTAGARVAGR